MKVTALAFALLAVVSTAQAEQEDKPQQPPQAQTVPAEPSQGWDVSAEEYAELLDDCGQTDNYGLATDD